MDTQVLEATNQELIRFITDFQWLETDYPSGKRPRDAVLQTEFLEKQKHGIKSWLILAPQRRASFGQEMQVKDVCTFAVKKRKRIESRGFQVFGEPDHRSIASFLVGTEPEDNKLVSPNAATKILQAGHRGIFMLYPVRERDTDSVTVGFELLFPKNNLKIDMNFTVLRKGEPRGIVVSAR
jgi:hypothetical protein